MDAVQGEKDLSSRWSPKGGGEATRKGTELQQSAARKIRSLEKSNRRFKGEIIK